MEVSLFFESVPHLADFFCSIPKAMQLKLQSSLPLLKHEQRLRTLFYLGRLEGQTATYQLAFGSPEVDLFQQRKFFYSHNGIEWYLLLEPPNWSEDWGHLHQEFTGELGFMLKFQPAHGGAMVKVREQNRLWYVVYAILREAAAVPRGALYWTTEQEVVLNPFFRGLTEKELTVFGNYQHFRRPERAAEENLRGRQECNLSMDVFDRLEVDVLPEGKSFAVRLNEKTQLVTWSSLHWIGLVNFHRAATNVYGFFYSGDGLKNWDLPLMLDL